MHCMYLMVVAYALKDKDMLILKDKDISTKANGFFGIMMG